MNADRAKAYGHVTSLVEDLGASKLHPDEQTVIREAADALVFAQDLEAPEAVEAIDRLHELVDRLVDADRVTTETAAAIITAVEACGPGTDRMPAAAR